MRPYRVYFCAKFIPQLKSKIVSTQQTFASLSNPSRNFHARFDSCAKIRTTLFASQLFLDRWLRIQTDVIPAPLSPPNPRYPPKVYVVYVAVINLPCARSRGKRKIGAQPTLLLFANLVIAAAFHKGRCSGSPSGRISLFAKQRWRGFVSCVPKS